VVVAAFASFTFPVIAHLSGLPPFIGILFGLGMVGGIIAIFTNLRPNRESHLSLDIQKLLAKVDITSLVFFIGILFAVGALEHLDILSAISHSLFGSDPETWRLVSGSVLLGVFSAIVDNIPLTAAAIDILNTTSPAIWSLLALAVGTGGSLLVIGSAAGVVAMGMVEGLTFKRYITLATVPALVGYVVAVGVWCVQYALFG
jgi:Na+/H+ antiporter NhaD/arsenite permease-like protein